MAFRVNLSPLFHSTVGFDRVAEALDRILNIDDTSSGYPPYNIERVNQESYRITMALAGFRRQDISVIIHEGNLVISGARQEHDPDTHYVHRGIATRSFERQFHLAESVHVVKASFEDGLLKVELKREIPENLKPITIPIEGSAEWASHKIENNKAS